MTKLRIIYITAFILVCMRGVAQERPLIGLSDTYHGGESAVPRSYVEAVLHADGIPVVIPLMDNSDKLATLLQSLDGIIFTGGEDFDPAYYRESPIPQMGKINAPRDTFDVRLLCMGVEQGLPVLGICRGIQLINIAYGGSLYQDLHAQYRNKTIGHRQKQPRSTPTHDVIVRDSTVFSGIVGSNVLRVNSFHHQAVKDVAAGFSVAGTSPDGLVEVIEKVDSANWVIGVQFHPEGLVTVDTTLSKIFQRFIGEAGRFKQKKQKSKNETQIQELLKKINEYIQNQQQNEHL